MLRPIRTGVSKMPLSNIIQKYNMHPDDIQSIMEWCMHIAVSSKQKPVKSVQSKKDKPDDYAPSIETLNCTVGLLHVDNDFYARPNGKAVIQFIPKCGSQPIVKEFTSLELACIVFDGVSATENNTFALSGSQIKPYMYEFVSGNFSLYNNVASLLKFDYVVTITRKTQKKHCPTVIKEIAVSGINENAEGFNYGTTQVHNYS